MMVVEAEAARAREENAHLQSILKQFLEGISVTTTVLSAPNPLLVINGAVRGRARRRGRHRDGCCDPFLTTPAPACRSRG
jgi:hypothetical protein